MLAVGRPHLHLGLFKQRLPLQYGHEQIKQDRHGKCGKGLCKDKLSHDVRKASAQRNARDAVFVDEVHHRSVDEEAEGEEAPVPAKAPPFINAAQLLDELGHAVAEHRSHAACDCLGQQRLRLQSSEVGGEYGWDDSSRERVDLRRAEQQHVCDEADRQVFLGDSHELIIGAVLRF